MDVKAESTDVATDTYHKGISPSRKEVEPWLVPLCAILGTSVGAAPISHYGIGVFITGMAAELNLSRSAASNIAALYLVGMGMGIPVAGLLVDRIGPRLTTVMAAIAMALSLVTMSLAESARMVTFLSAATGFLGAGTMILPYAVVIGVRFHRRRGLAMGMASCGPAIGGTMLAYFVGQMLVHYDWRVAAASLGGLIALISIPAALVGLRLPPNLVVRRRDVAHRYRGDGDVETTRPFWRNKAFWIVIGAISIANMTISGVVVQALPLLTDRGLSITLASTAVSAIAFCSIAGRLSAGYLMDRFFAPYVAGCYLALVVLPLFLMSSVGSPALLIMAFGILGLSLGSEADICSFMTSKYFARSEHGLVMGLFVAAYLLSNAIGVSVLGYIHDMFGSYRPGIIVGMFAAPIAAFLITRLGPYAEKSPSHH